MFHLPKDGAKVWVWPDPKRNVADAAPQGDDVGIARMPAHGRLVEWNAFRCEQYGAGELHFHDPLATKERAAKRAARTLTEDEKEIAELQAKHAHKFEHPPELKKQLMKQALEAGEGLFHKEALEHQALELEAKKKAELEVEKAELEAKKKAPTPASDAPATPPKSGR